LISNHVALMCASGGACSVGDGKASKGFAAEADGQR
jgi:hypothetical protein